MDAPKELSSRSKQVWADVAEQFEIDAAHATMLQTALEALDRYNEAREILNKEGICFTNEGSGLVKLHPATRIEKEARQGFIMAWRALQLDLEPPREVE